MKLLILTNEEDITADYVIIELKRRSIPFLRFNHEDFPQKIKLRWWSEGKATLSVSGHESLDAFSTIWYRRRAAPRLRGHNKQTRAFIEGESQEALQGLWATAAQRWVSHPAAIRAAEGKMPQLSYANKLGMRIPATLVTNDPAEARRFWREHAKSIVAKPLREKIVERDGRRKIIFTTSMEKAKASDFDAVSESPVMFQELIPKAFDLRVTVIGPRVFGTRIDSQERRDSRIDWRRARVGQLPHTAYEIDSATQKFCERMLHDHRLQFGAFDFVVTPGGETIFLELNPNGQWAWIEPLTGQPLRDAMIEHLCKGA